MLLIMLLAVSDVGLIVKRLLLMLLHLQICQLYWHNFIQVGEECPLDLSSFDAATLPDEFVTNF